MSGAVIVIDQLSGAGAGTPGVARDDLWLMQEVTLRCGTSGNSSYLWSLLSVPAGSAATLDAPEQHTCRFVPDLVGTYRVRLITNGGGPGNIQVLVIRVRFDSAGEVVRRGWAYPAVGETVGENNFEGNDRSWAKAIEDIFEDIRINGMRGQTVVPLSVIDFGAKPDGHTPAPTDNAPKFAQAIAAAFDTGQPLRIPEGVWRVHAPITLLDTVRLAGAGVDNTIIEVPAGFDFAAFDIDGASDVQLSNLTIRRADGVDAAGLNSRGVQVRGASSNVLVQGVAVHGAYRPLEVAGGIGTVPGVCRQITLRDCRLYDAGLFGVSVDDVDGLLMEGCYVERANLDCYKLRKLTGKVTLRSCWGLYGGRSTANAGDGIDCYAGGADFLLDGCVFMFNGEGSVGGNGITVKSDLLNKTDPETYGHVRNIKISNCTCSHNKGTGIGVYRHSGFSTADDPTIPLASGALVENCICEANDYYGFVVGGRSIMLANVAARGNGRAGIAMQENSIGISIVNPVILGNGSGGSTSYDHGIEVTGRKVTISGGHIAGTDSDGICGLQDYGSTPNPGAATFVGIYISKTADEVAILGTCVHDCRGADIVKGGGRVCILAGDRMEMSGAAQPVLKSWLKAKNWTDNDDGTFTHDAGDVIPLRQPGILTLNQTYSVEFEIIAISAGSLRASCGTTLGTEFTTTGKKVEDITCAGNTDFEIVPSADFVGTFRFGSVVNTVTTRPSALSGELRLPHGAKIAIRNSANTVDMPAVASVSTTMYFGSSNNQFGVLGASQEARMEISGAAKLRVTTGGIGFNGAAPTAKPTINWSATDPATLKTLMAYLNQCGLLSGSEQ